MVFEGPRQLSTRELVLSSPTDDDVVVDVAWTSISTGTERLLYTGEMPPFPGMGYPLVPGYEAVGRIREAGASGLEEGALVFVPGASCFGEVRGLFGAAASQLVVPASRVTPIGESMADQGVLLALAATAYHALAAPDAVPPDLIVGHGVLGRLLARIAVARGGEPVVWEKNAERATGSVGYSVVDPDADERRDYRSIVDASGDPSLLDTLVGRLAKGGTICLAGFYTERLAFTFPLAFMKEARFRVAAEWQPSDLEAVLALHAAGRLGLEGLISHRRPIADAADAYETAFGDATCLKMLIDWRDS